MVHRRIDNINLNNSKGGTMTAENITLNVSGLDGQAVRTATVSVLVAYDSANDTYVPLSCSPEGFVFTSGVN